MQEMYQYPPNQQQQFPIHQEFPHQPHLQQQQPIVQHVMVLQIPTTHIRKNNLKMVCLEEVEDRPVHTSCPSCHATILTTVTTQVSAYTHLLAGILCLLCCIPCACIPYFCNTSQNTVHTCPNCAAYIGTYSPFQRRYNRW